MMRNELENTNIPVKILQFFLSLRTAIWLLMTLLCLLFYGAVVMPANEEFLALHTEPLFRFMAETPPGITWWLWAAIGVLSLLTANTLLCSIESVVKKKRARHWMLIISPQVAHIGFLFILLAHMVSGYGSFKGTAVVYENAVLRLPGGSDVLFRKIDVDMDPMGYMKDWTADVEYFRGGVSLGVDRIRPNSPSFRDGYGVFIKNIRFQPYLVAMVEVCREPGAVWALIGGILFMAGMMTLLFSKIKKEEAKG
ncbi:MAG: cytochrome C biogenesis protein ResB [Nitrospirota bacterium]|nr:cytochrome C biogenesis protein ResB [Nitrospirota bacterium]